MRITEEDKSKTLATIKAIADHLEYVVTDEQFTFEHYRAEFTKDGILAMPVKFYGLNDCGAIGCVLGNAPFAPGLQPVKEDYDPLRISGEPGRVGFTYRSRYIARILPALRYCGYNRLFIDPSKDDSRLGRVKVLRDWLASDHKHGFPLRHRRT